MIEDGGRLIERSWVEGGLAGMVFAAARAHPAAAALTCGDERLDYRGYAAAVERLATELRDRLPAGSRVLTVLGNSIDACIAHFAVLAAGAQLVPVNPLYTSRELAYLLADAAPAGVIADAALRERLAPLLRAAAIGWTIWVGPQDRRLFADGDIAATAGSNPASPISPDTLALLQYTGGTSGHPKGVKLTHGALLANVAQREAMLPTRDRPAQRILCVMPLFHSYAIAMGLYLAAHCAGELVILPAYRREELFDLVERHRITIFPGSPTVYVGLMEHPRFAAVDWSSVHTCYSGASALPAAVLQRWQQAVGVPILEGYGQTEAGPVLTYNGPALPVKAGSVGLPLAATEVQVVDVDTGSRVLPRGERGEIRARGPQIMQGYRNLPEASADALRDGWLYTGDVGEFDDDGYLYIRDRKKDLVIVGGYNVYPREVEEVLSWHPDVVEVAVVGAPDAYRGELVHAFVVLRTPDAVDAPALARYCSDKLARYKVPAAFHLVDGLPKTGANKLDKKVLKERLSAAATTPGREP
ncbi:MAG TPA: AMP-binding protein [Burkholderiaceae bacterium]|nr:AMP-binding protein [Burkholderiaceae bacterium]